MIDGPTGIDLKPARGEQSRASFLEGVGRINPVRAGLLCRCPACGEGKLFAGFLKVVDSCAVCGTDFTGLNTGDGASVFIMQISGGISAFLALGLQIAFAPPLWVLLIVAVPLVLALSFGLMRPGKGLMIALQIRDRHHGAAPHV